MTKTTHLFAIVICVGILTVGCDNMRNDNRYKPLEKSDFFEDGSSSRPLVKGTVPRGHLEADDHLYRGKVDGKHVETFPFPITEDIMKRGQERYNIYCAVCHDGEGTGNGMVVQRGFKKPLPFHEERLQKAPVGYFFDVMTNGFGTMSSYKGEIKPEDRWAIAAYIRALQDRKNVSVKELSKEEAHKLASKGDHH